MLMHTVSGWICLTGSFRQLLWKKIRLRQLEHSPKSCPYDAIWTLLEDFIQQAKRLLPFSVFCHTSQDLAARHNTWTKPGLSTVRKIRAKPSSRILISLKWFFLRFGEAHMKPTKPKLSALKCHELKELPKWHPTNGAHAATQTLCMLRELLSSIFHPASKWMVIVDSWATRRPDKHTFDWVCCKSHTSMRLQVIHCSV